MKNIFLYALKLSKNLNGKKINKGFTLIELLVVVIIIGVLSAISLPSLLSQVAKARETEARAVLGALNLAQQAYYTETASFADAGELNKLEVATGNSNYYTFSIVDEGVQKATGKNNTLNGTRNYLSAIQYATDNRSYNLILCRSINQATGYDLDATDVTNAGVEVSTNVLACNTTNAEPVN